MQSYDEILPKWEATSFDIGINKKYKNYIRYAQKYTVYDCKYKKRDSSVKADKILTKLNSNSARRIPKVFTRKVSEFTS